MKLVIELERKLLLKIGLGIVVLAALLLGIFIGAKNKNSSGIKKSLSKSSVFNYGQTIRLSGKLTQRQFYGAPGFGQDPETDAKETADLLVLDSPIKILAGKTEEIEKAYEAVSELQLVNEKGLVLDDYLEEEVEVKGELMAAHTGHHHTDVLLVLETIVTSPKKALEKETKVEKKLLQPSLNQYTFKTYEGRKFTFSYAKTLDLIEPTGFMVGERVRLQPKGESYETSFLVTVDQPSTDYGEIAFLWETEPVKYGDNSYKRANAWYQPENKLVMVIFQPLTFSGLGSIDIGLWDNKRLDEALEQTATILKTLKEVK